MNSAVSNKMSNAAHEISLPEKPLVVIKPSKGWIPVNFRDLWNYRDLLYIMTMRDIKVRYKQPLLGAAWAIIQPLLTMLIFTLLFGGSPECLRMEFRIRSLLLRGFCPGRFFKCYYQ